jgi:dienelactone hydrolase
MATHRDLEYAPGRPFDLYLPDGDPAGVVVLVSGYRTADVEKMFGGNPRELPPARAWGERVTKAGLAGVIYGNVDPTLDLDALLAHLRGRTDLDGERIALWAASGNGPLALSRLGAATCGVLLYPFMLGPEVATAAATFGFANPGTAPETLPPIYLVRAGADENLGLNATVDRFIADALARDLPLAFENVAGAPHAFDYRADSPASRAVIERALDFAVARLRR